MMVRMRRLIDINVSQHAGGRNSREDLTIYAASRINQLRKSSSAASQLRKINKINYLRGHLSSAYVSLVPSVICDGQAALDDVRN
jgi:hypothetical protein